MKNRSRNSYIAAVCIIAVVIIIAIVAVVRIRPHASSSLKAEADDTRVRLEAMADRDISSAQETIDQVQGPGEEETEVVHEGGGEIVFSLDGGMLPLEELREYNYKEIFSDCVVLGDSIAMGLDSYGILNSSEVFAVVGVYIGQVDASLTNAAAMNPKKAFFTYGVNDLNTYEYQLDWYRDDYTSLLKRAQELMPNTELYVALILPVTDYALSEQPNYARMDEYNEIIKEVCDELGVHWMDLSFTFLDEYYDDDGIHAYPEFYYGWLYYMAVGSGLIQEGESQ